MQWLRPDATPTMRNHHSMTFQAFEPGPHGRTQDLRVLVIVADGAEPSRPTILQALDYLGTPYSVFKAAPLPTDADADRLSGLLSRGDHAFYQGVILSTGHLVYRVGTEWVGALTPAEWRALWSFEAGFGVRQVTWYTFPSGDYGFEPPIATVRAGAGPVMAWLTGAGRRVFPYLDPEQPLAIANAHVYLAHPLDEATTPLLTDAHGNALGAVHRYPDGRENLALTFDNNPHLIHSLVLAYGLISWVAKGLFLGERQVYACAHVDDLMIDNKLWDKSREAPSGYPAARPSYRLTGADLLCVVAWQQSMQLRPTTTDLTLDLAFNGIGSTGLYQDDTLSPVIRQVRSQFKWISHTYSHPGLDTADYRTSELEIQRNLGIASTFAFSRFSRLNLVTPETSGLDNAAFLRAASDLGVRYLVSDTSHPGHVRMLPNTGLRSSYQPEILVIPRHPTNLFFDVSTPEQWVSEYNERYRSVLGQDLTYHEILDRESLTLLEYMLRGDMLPWMFHQSNLRGYDHHHSVLGDLIGLALEKYGSLLVQPILSPTMDELGRRMERRMRYNAAAVGATLGPGPKITFNAELDAEAPVTGLLPRGAELFGGQSITWIDLKAGEPVVLSMTEDSVTQRVDG